MTTTRFLCPLDCGWHHDQEDPTLSPAAVGLPLPTPDLAYVLGHLHGVEEILRAHLETHTLLEWVTALTAVQRRAETAEPQVVRIRAFLEDMAGWCSPHGVATDYAQRGLDALDGIDPFDAIRAKRQDREDALDAAIAHTALAAIRDYVETTDDTGIRTREHLLGILNEAGVPSVVAEELDGADRYADMVDAPLRPETIAAIAERIKAGDYPIRKVSMRGSYPAKPGRATMAADRCPQCGGDNTEPWAACSNCAAAGEQP